LFGTLLVAKEMSVVVLQLACLHSPRGWSACLRNRENGRLSKFRYSSFSGKSHEDSARKLLDVVVSIFVRSFVQSRNSTADPSSTPYY
jgi:hypothetical protein